jgi:ABC-2 type transport system ATP-binding protein
VGAETIITLQAEPITPAFIGALGAISGVRSVEENPRGLQILAGDSRRLIPHIAETALAQDVDLSDISVSTPTLETVFMRLTGRELRD